MLALFALALVLRLVRLGEVPPGLHVDEAHNGVDALRIIAGARPVFLEANNGRDVLYSYVQAPLVALFGPTPWSLRLASALLGSLTVPLTYVLVRALPESRDRAVAAAAASLTAMSLWHLHFSRIGIRGVALPLVIVTLGIFLWRGIRSGRRSDYAVAGFVLGLGLYTHPAARVLPAVPLLLLAYGVATDRGRSRATAIGLGWLIGAALLTSLPLALYVSQHPGRIMSHPVAVSVLDRQVGAGRPIEAVFGNVRAVAGAFVVEGSRSWYHNLSRRPVFDPLLAVFFVLGVGQLAWRLFAARSPAMRLEAVFIGLALTVMALPTVLTDGAPNYSRAIGLLPVLFVPPALALVRASRWLADTAGRPQLSGPLVALALCVSGVWTARDYFVTYARAPEPQGVFGTEAVEKAVLLRALAQEVTVYPTTGMLGRSVMKYLIHGAGVVPLDLNQGMVVPAGRTAWYAFAAGEEDEAATDFGSTWPSLPRMTLTGRQGMPRWLLYRSAEVPQPSSSTMASLADGTELLGDTLQPADVAPGESPQLTLYWRSAGPLAKDYAVFVHVVDGGGRRVGQHDKQPLGGSYPTSRWRDGDLIVDRFHPVIDPGTAPGSYTILAGWYDQTTGERLTVYDAAGRPLPESAVRLATRLSVVDRRGADATTPHLPRGD